MDRTTCPKASLWIRIFVTRKVFIAVCSVSSTVPVTFPAESTKIAQVRDLAPECVSRLREQHVLKDAFG